MRRRLWTLLLLVLAPILPLVAVALWQFERPLPKPEPTMENFLGLRRGVTEEEAVAVLGRPDRRDVSGPFVKLYWDRGDRDICLVSKDKLIIGGSYQGDGWICPFGLEPKPWWQRLRDWLPWRYLISACSSS